MLQSVIEKLGRYSRRFHPLAPPTAQGPLIDDSGLRELALYARSLPWSLLAFRRAASHPLIGETLSSYRGRGLEFEENRAYQAGDEPRLLNWRLYARAGELYTKVFTEERRPQVFVLMDRRGPMRFGTRRQLKATFAAKIAACYAWQAQHQVLAVGGLILNQAVEWFDPAMGEVALQTFLQSVTAPCPPLPFEHDQPDLAESLQLLMHRLPEGSFVVLLSDFADFDPDAAMQLLPQLTARHTVQAYQILDPVERRLPVNGDFLIEDGASPRPLRIDGRDGLQQTSYVETFEERRAKLADCFTQCGIPLKTCTTEDDVETCLGQPDADTYAD